MSQAENFTQEYQKRLDVDQQLLPDFSLVDLDTFGPQLSKIDLLEKIQLHDSHPRKV